MRIVPISNMKETMSDQLEVYLLVESRLVDTLSMPPHQNSCIAKSTSLYSDSSPAL